MSPFPTDTEPPPAPWWRRLLPAVAVLVLGLIGYATAVAWPSASHPHPSTARTDVTIGGRVLIYDDAKSALALVNPDGSQSRPASTTGSVDEPPVASLDGRLLISDTGAVARFRGDRITFPPGRLSKRLGQHSQAIGTPPDTGHGRVLVTGGVGPNGDEPLRFFDIATGRPSRPWGSVDSVAGDPRGDAAWVSIPSGPPVTVGEFSEEPDSQVQRVTASGKRTVLFTTRAGHLARHTAYHLILYPAPDGSRIAIVAQPLSGATRSDVVLVVTRTGRVVDTLPRASSSLAWSPDSSTLALLDDHQTGLILWQPGLPPSPPVTLSGAPSQTYFVALWSPTGADVLCVGHDAAGQPLSWTLVGAANGRVDTVRFPGFPLAWYAGAGP